MEDRKKKEYSFAKMLFYSAVIIIVLYSTDFLAFYITTEDQCISELDATQDFYEDELVEATMDYKSEVLEDLYENEGLQHSQNEIVEKGESSLEHTSESKGQKQQEIEEQHPSDVVVGKAKADRSYFDNALFIGDSRTEGLYEYGDLQNATVLAASGMSVYKIYDYEFKLSDGSKKYLEQIIDEKQFGKIYLMLGINELGYDFKATVKKYEELLQWLEEKEPNAIIYLEANMHITEEKSLESDYCTNANIDAFNNAVKGMADGKKKIYLDVNSLFDNERGSLDKKYTSDQSHVLGKYYKNWVDWLLTEVK